MSKITINAAYQNLLNRGRLSPNPAQVSLVNRFATLQNSLLEDPGPQNGLYIHGSVGTGKSYLMDLFYATVPQDVSKRRVHFNEFMMDVHHRLHHARSLATYSGDPLVQIGREVKNESRLLCFDEFQVTDIADAMILKRLLTAVWDNGGVMVSTSNRHPTQLYERGLNRALFVPFIIELQKRCEVWEMGGNQDYRTTTDDGDRPRKRVKTFFSDSWEFDDAISIATGGHSLQQTTIPVMMNRSLVVDAYTPKSAADGRRSGLVVKSSFSYLCERPLGSSDYHALCARASTVYLSGLRRFRADELDFIRRFITLIDLAYESKTRIICHASVPLQEVFANIVPTQGQEGGLEMTVRGEGGSSSSMMSTFIGGTEWSATGLAKASLATDGAGETDVRFAVGRALSRLSEMGWSTYGVGGYHIEAES